jgi:hypothetical protein
MRQLVRSCIARVKNTNVVCTSVDDAAKVGKDAISSLLAPAKDVIALLNVVAQVHPAVQVKHNLLIDTNLAQQTQKAAVGVVKVRSSCISHIHG